MSDILIEEALKNGDIKIKPEGYSMYPFIVPGRDHVILSSISDAGKLKRGDVVLYRRKSTGILVLHRVWKIKKDGFYMVGDNQSEIEGPVDISQIKAIMTGIIRGERFVSAKNFLYRVTSRIWLFMRPVRMSISRKGAAIKRFFKRKF